jgi:hypothetical protein
MTRGEKVLQALERVAVPTAVVLLAAGGWVMNSRVVGLTSRVTGVEARTSLLGVNLSFPSAHPTGAAASPELRFDERTLLFYLSPTCRPCTDAMPAFRALKAQVADHIRVVVVSAAPPDQLDSYLIKHEFGGQGYSVPHEALHANGLLQSPTIALVSNGRIERAWVGPMTQPDLDHVVEVTTHGTGRQASNPPRVVRP